MLIAGCKPKQKVHVLTCQNLSTVDTACNIIKTKKKHSCGTFNNSEMSASSMLAILPFCDSR